MFRTIFNIILVILFAKPIHAENAQDNLNEVLLVANNKGGTIDVVDTSSFEVMCSIDVIPDIDERRKEFGFKHKMINEHLAGWRYADDLAVSPDGSTLYVSRASVADVAVFDVASGKLLWRLPIGKVRADHLRLSPSGNHLVVSAVAEDKVKIIDTAKKKIIAEISTGGQPHVIKYNPDESKIFIGEKLGKGITIVDANSFDVVDRLVFDEGVRPFDFSKDGKRLYVQLSKFHGFQEYDLENNRLLKTVHLPENAISDAFNGEYPGDTAHHGLSVSKNGQDICITAAVSDYAALVSRSNLEVKAFIPVDSQPSYAVHSLDGQYCYISSRGANTVSVISYAEQKVVKKIKVGEYPQRLHIAKVPTICGADELAGSK